MTTDPLFIRACRGETTPRIPIWIMRQAGRFLPEYREVRERTSFMDLCRSPELILEVTMQPIRRFGFDAAIVFSDILLLLEPMGLEVDFSEGPPRIRNPIRDRDAVQKLHPLNTQKDLPFLPRAVEILCGELGDTPLIGFAGSPFTVASYAVEGGGSKSYAHLKGMLFGDPDAAHALFRRLTDAIVDVIDAQLAAGARAFQVFDSWGGMLGEADYRQFALPYLNEIFDRLRPRGAPGILYVNGGAHLVDVLADIGSDVVGVDWRTDLVTARAKLPGKALQGNLDPTVLLGNAVTIQERTQETLRAGTTGGGGYIFNLGHGILPPTPPENLAMVVDAVRAFEREGSS